MVFLKSNMNDYRITNQDLDLTRMKNNANDESVAKTRIFGRSLKNLNWKKSSNSFEVTNVDSG